MRRFCVADATRLPCEVVVVAGFVPSVDGTPCLNAHPVMRIGRKVRRVLTGAAWEREITDGYLAAFRRFKPSVVLAQYGPTGVRVSEACRLAGLPLVVHFHGFDATIRTVSRRTRLLTAGYSRRPLASWPFRTK